MEERGIEDVVAYCMEENEANDGENRTGHGEVGNGFVADRVFDLSSSLRAFTGPVYKNLKEVPKFDFVDSSVKMLISNCLSRINTMSEIGQLYGTAVEV